jgi:hypothetical protein
VLDHGFARIRGDACTHEYLLAFSGTRRCCRPNCHAKWLAVWKQWQDTTLLAPVQHRQLGLTIPGLTDALWAIKVPERDRRQVAARRSALPSPAIALSACRIVDPPRLKYLSRTRMASEELR